MAEKKKPTDQSADPTPDETPVAGGPEEDAPVEEAPVEETPAEEKKPKGRRGSAETSTKAKPKAVPAPRNDAGLVEVRARARYVRSAPRKARS